MFEVYNVVDLLPDTIEGIKTGKFNLFGLAVSDYLAEKGLYYFAEKGLLDFLKEKLKGKKLIACAIGGTILGETLVNDIKEWYSNSDWEICIIDFHNLEYNDDNVNRLNTIHSDLEQYGTDMHFYDTTIGGYLFRYRHSFL